MERKSSSSQEVNTLDSPWGQMASERCHNFRKRAQRGHFSRDVATPHNPSNENPSVEINRSSSSDDGLKQCYATSESSHSEPYKTTLHERTSESNLDSGLKTPETKGDFNTPYYYSTQVENIKRLYRSWLTRIYNLMSCSSYLSTMFAMLMVGAGDDSPPRMNPIPRVVVTPPGPHELRLLCLSPPKSPPRSLRESVERVKAFPKIPKRQFTTPEKSPEKQQQQQQRRSCNRRILSLLEEGLPCGGFRLPSPSKVSRPPRDPFAIPEKFELAPSKSFDFISDVPQTFAFPSLIVGPDPIEKPQDDNNETSQQSSDVSRQEPADIPVKCEPPVADANQSGSPEKDNRLQESLFNPNSGNIPYYSPGGAEVKRVTKNLSKLAMTSESDPVQPSVQDVIKEFDQVYRQCNSHLNLRISIKVREMEEFIARVRRETLRFTHVGAIESQMHNSVELQNAMARIINIIAGLKQSKVQIASDCEYSYRLCTNLKSKPSATYLEDPFLPWSNDINELRTKTKELSDLVTKATKLIDSYRPDKNYIAECVFGKNRACFSI